MAEHYEEAESHYSVDPHWHWHVSNDPTSYMGADNRPIDSVNQGVGWEVASFKGGVAAS